MELLSLEIEHIRRETYTVLHEGTKYTFIDMCNSDGKITDNILRDENGNAVEDPAIFEAMSNYLDAVF